MKKLNLGCGEQTPDGWINVDYAMGARISRIPLLNKIGFTKVKWDKNIFIHNLLKPFPWETDSVDIIYSSHTLEHFTREEGLLFLNECYRVLKPVGILRIVVPDLKTYVKDYLDGKIEADHFLENLTVLTPPAQSVVKKILLAFVSFPHKCMYDLKTLMNTMSTIGFDVYSMAGFESKIAQILDVEIKERTFSSIIVEGYKKQLRYRA